MTEPDLNAPFAPVDMVEVFITRCGGLNNAVYVLRRVVTGHRITPRWLDGRKELPVEVISAMYGYLHNNS